MVALKPGGLDLVTDSSYFKETVPKKARPFK